MGLGFLINSCRPQTEGHTTHQEVAVQDLPARRQAAGRARRDLAHALRTHQQQQSHKEQSWGNKAAGIVFPTPSVPLHVIQQDNSL
jgi:hypothetical protein